MSKKKQKLCFKRDDESENVASRKIILILEKVKQMIMSNELKLQKEAVAWLVNELTVNSNIGRDLLIVTLLKSEIVALLCEMIMEMDCGPLVAPILDCLSKLTISEQFYRQNHATYVVASVLRFGHFLTLKNNDNNNENRIVVLEEISCTLEKIIEGATIFHLPPNEICELDQILEFFKKLLIAETQVYRIIFSAAKIISVILRYIRIDDYIRGMDNPDNEISVLFTVIESTINLMWQIVDEKNSHDGKHAFRAMVMICAICAEAIPSCVEVHERDNNEINGNPKSSINYKTKLVNLIYSVIMKSVIPNFNKIEPDAKNGEFYIWFVSSLNGIYDVNCCNTRDLSNYLVEQGYLQTLPLLATFPTQNLRNQILLLLSRVLTTLASHSLFNETNWLKGEKQFQTFIFNAFKSLPLDPSNWLEFIAKGDERADALLVLFYYNFLGESISNAALYLPLIVEYVMSVTNSKMKNKFIGIRKALWFTFSIAAVSHENPSKVESYEQSVTRLFNDLESLDIKQCYTHHPAVVIHCMKNTALISNKFRSRVVGLWLENGGDVTCIVDPTAPDNSSNYYTLLEIVKTGSPQSVDGAMNAVSKLVKSLDTINDLGNIVWDMLQQILSTGYERDAHNTMSVLKLAAMFEPNNIPGSVLVCLLYRLTSFILKNQSDLILVSLGIKNAYVLLSLSVRRNDVRGVKMFTSKPKLIKLLKYFAFENVDDGLSYICFNCLSTLIQYQANYSIQCEHPLEIDAEELLQQLYLDNCTGALQFAISIFTSEIERTIIVLKNVSSAGQHYDDVIRKIYIQLHMIHAKSDDEGRHLCYALLEALLSYCSSTGNEKLVKILCEVDWTFILIEINIEASETLDPDLMNFVSKWLIHRYQVMPLYQPSGGRSLCRDQFETTLDLLGNAALNNYEKYPEQESLAELINSLILFEEHFSGNIGTELKKLELNRNEVSTNLSIVYE